MGALLGLVCGVGLVLAWRSGSRRPPKRNHKRLSLQQHLAEILAQAGIESVTPSQLLASSVGLAAAVFLFAAAISRAFTIALAFATFAALAPVSLVRYRQRKRRSELRDLWPEAVDNLASAVRAGLSLPEALTQLGMRGPEELRRPFQRFGEDYRATGRFAVCLDRLKATLADPTGDRIVESLRLARDVGGTDLGRLLRTLSAFLREDARTRAELETRQGWSVKAVHSLSTLSPGSLLSIARQTLSIGHTTASSPKSSPTATSPE